MKRFYLNIGSLGSPVIGSGWLEVTPAFGRAALERSVEANVRVRDDLKGALTFFGVDFLGILGTDALQIPFKIEEDSVVVLTGQLSKQGTFNERANRGEFSFLKDDKYSTILQNLDVELALKGRFNNVLTQDYNSEIYLEGAAYQSGSSGSFTTPDNFTDCGSGFPAAWNVATNYIAGNPYSGGLWRGSFVDCFVRYDGKSYVANADNVGVTPGTDPSTWVELDGPPGDVQRYGQERADFKFDDAAQWNGTGDFWFLAGCTADAYQATFNSSDIFSILNALLGDADDEISINESTYCPYFNDNFPALLGLYFHSYADNFDVKIKLNDLLQMFKDKFNLDWFLDDDKKFFFAHPSEWNKTVGTGANDLTTYKGRNWTEDRHEYKFKVTAEVKKESWQFGESTRADFDVISISYNNNFEKIDEVKDDFGSDLKTSLTSQPDFLLICADKTTKEIVNATGLLSGVTEYNGLLATTRLINDHLLDDRPFDEGTFLSSTTVLVPTRNNEVKISAPFNNQTEIDFDDLVKADVGNLELEKISVPLDGSFGFINANF